MKVTKIWNQRFYNSALRIRRLDPAGPWRRNKSAEMLKNAKNESAKKEGDPHTAWWI